MTLSQRIIELLTEQPNLTTTEVFVKLGSQYGETDSALRILQANEKAISLRCGDGQIRWSLVTAPDCSL